MWVSLAQRPHCQVSDVPAAGSALSACGGLEAHARRGDPRAGESQEVGVSDMRTHLAGRPWGCLRETAVGPVDGDGPMTFTHVRPANQGV